MTAPITARKAYFYATSTQAQEINAAGFILPNNDYAPAPAKPLILSSRHVYLEPTMRKAFIDGKWIYNLSAIESNRLNSFVRYGIAADNLLTFAQVRNAAAMPYAAWLTMRRKGVEQNADPRQWRFLLEPVSLAAVTIEKMDDVGSWKRVQPVPHTDATTTKN